MIMTLKELRKKYVRNRMRISIICDRILTLAELYPDNNDQVILFDHLSDMMDAKQKMEDYFWPTISRHHNTPGNEIKVNVPPKKWNEITSPIERWGKSKFVK